MLLQRAIRKHGEDAFQVSTLQVCSSQEELDAAEKCWIQKLGSITNGYNVAEGGKNSRTLRGENHPFFGKHLTPEHRANIAKASLGKKMSERSKRLISERGRGRKHTDEARKKIALASKGHTLSTTARRKISQATSKPIIQSTTTGQFIARYDSITAAAQATGFARTKLVTHLKQGTKYHECWWKYDV